MDDVSSHFAEDLAVFSAAIDTIPIKSADAERGFSTMNLICTPLRNRLGVERLSNLIFVSLVGPSLDYFNALPYVKKWLTRGHRAACDNQFRFFFIYNSNPDYVTVCA